jgi:multidrug efflux system outer membrane protein
VVEGLLRSGPAGLIDEAIRSNYDLRTAVARVEQAQAWSASRARRSSRRSATRACLASAPVHQPGSSQPRRSTSSRARSTSPGRSTCGVAYRRATEAAQAELLATEEFRRGVLLSLVSSVAQAYFELLELDSELAISRATVESFTETLQLFERRYQGGVGSLLQTDRAAAALYETQANVPQLEAQIVAKENEINVLLGGNPDTVLRGALLIDQVVPPRCRLGCRPSS